MMVLPKFFQIQSDLKLPASIGIGNNPAMRIGLILAIAIVFTIHTGIVTVSFAQNVGASGLPLPRYVSLKSKRVNMRVGPGRDYKVQWLYVRKGLPMEIIQEFGNWRKVRDPNGNEGWILHSLLDGKRRVIIAPWDIARDNSKSNTENSTTPPSKLIDMHKKSSNASAIIARIEPGTLANVEECKKNWCELTLASTKNRSQIKGFVEQSLLWGVYPDEVLKN